MARNGKARASKGAKGKVGRPPKAVDQEIKGSKKVVAQDTGPLSGAGHNLTAVQKLIVPYSKRYNKILDEKASTAAAFMADVRVLIEDAANDLGCKKRLVRMALQEKRRLLKVEEKENDMDREELDQLDTMYEALGNYAELPLGEAAIKAEAKAKAAAKPRANKGNNVVALGETRDEDEGAEQTQAA
jgi:hypothetical protein